MLQRQTREDLIFWFLLAVIAIAIALISSGLFGQDEQPNVIIGGEGEAWVQVKHESGAEYVIRKSAIIGFQQHKPEPAQRNEVWLSGGRSIKTSMPLKEFTELVDGASDD